jgi:hypothetical protein
LRWARSLGEKGALDNFCAGRPSRAPSRESGR